MNNLKQLLRAYSLPASIAPLLIAVCCAIKVPHIAGFGGHSFLLNTVILFAGIISSHLAGNLFDDYLDVKNALKCGAHMNEINFKNKEKAKLILNGTYSLKQVEKILVILLIIAFMTGVYFIFLKGPVVLFYMTAALVLAAFYPLSSKFASSELTIGIIFGPLLINGAYFALSGLTSPVVFNISIASAIMTSILLIVHSLMDYEFDVNSGKKTLPVLLKNKNLTINFISILIFIAYAILYFTSIRFNISKWLCIPIILSLPAAINLILSLYDYIEIKNVEFTRRWYLGTMENWDKIKESGFDYFMYRFYLARNASAIFNISLAVICLFVFVPFFDIDFLHFNFIREFLF